MAARKWTDADTARMVELHAQGVTLTAIAKDLDRSKAVVSRYAALQVPPLSFDRSATAAATQAKVADAKSRRATLQLALLEDAEKLRTQLWQECVVFNFGGKDNTFEQRTLAKPPFADQLKIMQATGVAIDRSLKLDDHDSGAGAAAVVGLLQQTAAALGITDDADTTP